MIGLIGHKRAERVDEYARGAVEYRLSNRMDVEDEGLTAARAHHGEHTATLIESVERVHQRAIQRHQLATIGGRGVQKPLVDARVAAGIEQVDASGRPIAPRAAAHR